MGILTDLFKKGKAKEIEIKEQGMNQEEGDKKEPKVGDKFTEGPFELTFFIHEITKSVGRDEYETVGHIPAWKIRCVDTTTPMKDVVMPDEFMGYPIINACDCFKDCYNIASVEHISNGCLGEHGSIYGMFDFSGLREVPEQLKGRNIGWVSPKAYVLPDYAKTESLYSHDADLNEIAKLSHYLKAMQEKMDKELALIDDEFSPYARAEMISFVYNFHPITVIRLQDHNSNWFAINMDNIGKEYRSMVEPYDQYMWQFKSDKIQGLTFHSFEEIQLSTVKDILITKCNDAIHKAEKEKESHIASLNERIATETAKADKAQEGLDFKPKEKAQTEILKDSKDEVAIGEE